jgi:ectoine hydroxylase-related dioxygenase (phytanoyl-CoA dioxygenase family)
MTRPLPVDQGSPQPMLDNDGFATIPAVLTPRKIDHLLKALAEADISRARRNDAVFGGRNLLSVPAISQLATSQAIRGLVEPVVGADATAVRALFFDKTPGANWPVLWHQDLSIAVAERHELEGWGPWSTKANIPHVQPPVSILEAMLAVRLHLDDCGADNGPLRVIPGSHRSGRLSRDQIVIRREEIGEVTCEAPAGASLLIRPLLLHASSPARAPSHRRVVHIEYAPAHVLPTPLNWARL